MAEAMLHQKCGASVHVESAGLTPGTLNPLAVAALKERGIDIEGKPTRDALELYKSGARYHYVITVCDEASAERCPVFPGALKRLHWSLPDPSQFTGTWDEKLAKTRDVLREIERHVDEWCAEHCEVTA